MQTSNGFIKDEPTNPLYKVRAGHSQAQHVPYLRREFDASIASLLADPEWAKRLGSTDPLRVLLAMLAVHSECVDSAMTAMYPHGLGASHGTPLSAVPKAMDRMRVKVTGDYGGVGVAPNRPGESWRPLHQLQGVVPEGAIGEPFYDNVPAPPHVLLARASTATACLMDTVRRSLTTDGLEAQEAFLEELVGDAERWRLLRIKSTMQDDAATVKQCLVNMAFTPLSTGVDASRPQTYADMTSSADFDLAAERVRERNHVDAATIAAACELLRSPAIRDEPTTLVVEVQLYISQFLEERKRVHGFYKILRADTPWALTADCAKFAAPEGSTMACDAAMQQRRAVVTSRLMGGEACFRLAEWRIEGLEPSQASDLADILAETVTVRSLDLDIPSVGCELGDAGATALARGLGANRGLSTVDLAHNLIGPVGATALASSLEHNHTLRELRLSINPLGDEGATALATWLRGSATLVRLELSDCRVGHVGGAAIATALEANTSLRVLIMATNTVGDDGATAFGRALTVNTTLIELDLGRNCIADVGASALADALVVAGAGLRVLNLFNNSIAISGGVRLAEALRVAPSLELLDVRVNFEMRAATNQALRDAAEANPREVTVKI